MRADFDQIKKTTDIVTVIQRYGIELKKQGADYVGLCPFHQDTKPSLRVTPSKGLYHCMSCGAAGNAIQFVSKKENLTVKEAALRLMGNMPGVQRGSDMPTAAPAITASHPQLFNAVIDHYHQTLIGRNRRGLDYIKGRGLGDNAMLAHFKIGFVDGTLKTKLTPAQVKLAQDMGLFNDKRNERFYGRVVVPIYDDAGNPVGLCGRNIDGRSDAKYLNLPGPQRGVWNGGRRRRATPITSSSPKASLTASPCGGPGIKNSIAVCGVEGWSPLHTALIQKHSVRKVVLARSTRSKAGEEATQKLTPQLVARGVKVHRFALAFEGINDACDYFQYTKALDFKGMPDTFACARDRRAPDPDTPRRETARLSLMEKTDDTALFQNGNVAYRVKGIDQTHLRIVLAAKTDTARHIDTTSTYTASRARKAFSGACAERLGLEVGKIEDDLLALLELVEQMQRQEAAPVTANPAMTDEETKAARAFLETPRLLDRIAGDLEIIGYVGEARTKKLAYPRRHQSPLAQAVVRDLPRPIGSREKVTSWSAWPR